MQNPGEKKARSTLLILYFVAFLVASIFLFQLGRSQMNTLNQSELGPLDLLKQIGNPQIKLQIVDIRPSLDDFAQAHIPGALPFPECDPAKTPKAALERIFSYASAAVVSENGDRVLFQKCLTYFTQARNVAGGFVAWQDALLPEDEGDYTPPKDRGGGGCL